MMGSTRNLNKGLGMNSQQIQPQQQQQNQQQQLIPQTGTIMGSNISNNGIGLFEGSY